RIKEILGQMIAANMIKVEDGVPILNMKEYIMSVVESEKHLLLPEEIDRKYEDLEKHVQEIKEQQVEESKQIYETLKELRDNMQSDEEWNQYKEAVSKIRTEHTDLRAQIVDQQLLETRLKKEM